MIASSQIRAARALLDWSQTQLAMEANVSLVTVKRMEGAKGRFQGKAETIWRVQEALERAGVIFLQKDTQGGVGVRMA